MDIGFILLKIFGFRMIEIILLDGTKRTIRKCNSCNREIFFSEWAMGTLLPYNVSNKRQHVCVESLTKYGTLIENPRKTYYCEFCKENITGRHWLRKLIRGNERY